MSDLAKEFLEETLRINGKDLPHTLFKFSPSESKYFEENARNLVMQNKIWLSGRDSLNDPFDTRPCLMPDQDEREYRSFFDRVSAENSIETNFDELLQSHSGSLSSLDGRMKDLINESLDAMGICSFTSRVDHPLMWSHYASSHFGWAWIFAHAVEGVDFGAMPVRYQDQYPSLRTTETGNLIRQMLVKGTAWSYENEWRLVESGAAGKHVQLDPSALRGIVFGVNTRPEHIDFILRLFADRVKAGLRPLRVYGARQREDRFDLEFFRMGVAREMVSVDFPAAF